MALRDQIGLTGPDYEVDIERGKIREFARAMAAPLPEFMAGRHPVIPATFLVSAPYTWGYTLERPRGTAFETIDHDLAIPLHAEESFAFHGEPPRAGERLIARAKLEKVWEKVGSSGGALTFLTMLTEYRTLSGDIRAEQRSTSVTTGQPPGSTDWDVELPPYQPDYRHLERPSPFAAIERAGLDRLHQGQGPGRVAAGPLLLQDIVRFQGVVGEDDPLHHDQAWARRQHYPSTFGLGTHQASQMAAYAAYWLAPEAVRAFRVRFRSICWPGDDLSFNGTVARKNDAERTAEVHLTCTRKTGELVSECWINYNFSTE